MAFIDALQNDDTTLKDRDDITLKGGRAVADRARKARSGTEPKLGPKRADTRRNQPGRERTIAPHKRLT